MNRDRYAMAPDLGDAFTQKAFPTLADQIGNVAANNTYTYLADPDHREAAILEVAGNADTMRALARSGVKHIALEYLNPGEQPLLDAYARGEISDNSMEYFLKYMTPVGVELYMGGDETHHGPALYNLIREARANGIKVHGVNGQEGAEDKALLKAAVDDRAIASSALTKAMDEQPAFFSMSDDEQYDFVRDTLKEAGLDESQVDDQMLMMGWDVIVDESGSVSSSLSEDFLIRRMLADDEVAVRIAEVTNNEKTVVIYGERHMNRAEGDLDALLPGAVVTVYTDMQKNRAFVKEADDYFGSRGFSPVDISEYSVDLKDGVWRDELKGQIMPVEVPRLNSLPHTFEERHIPVPVAKPQDVMTP